MPRPRGSPERSLGRQGALLAAGIATLIGGVMTLSAAIDVSGAIIASGNLVVESELKKVQHPTGGVVADILVTEGARVAKDDVVMRLDPTVARATLNAVTKDLRELAARQARLEAERDGAAEPAFPAELLGTADDEVLAGLIAGERRLFRYRTAALAGQKAQLRERIGQLHDETRGLTGQLAAKRAEIELVGKELASVGELWDKKLIPLNRVTALERESARLGGDAGRLEAQLAQIRGKVSETELQIIQIDQSARSEIGKELADIRAKTSELTEKRVAARDQSERIEIRAPHSGLVHKLAVHTRGGVVAAGEQIMQIVPEGEALTVEARIPPREIDQVRPGQPAALRFSTLNQRTTPEFEGEVLRISADAVRDERVEQPYYLVRLRFAALPEPEGGRFLPGMPVEVFIRTDSRSLISYLVKPMLDQVRHAFREK
jgi:HlyD family secretion protein